jgi:2-polyprenyl-3-methyl-5-hydroxy-6-metoxy-1,4-benzoquinol methylase
MSNIWTDRWNERYSNEAYAYGLEPNAFLKQELEKLSPSKILFPAEGEGRNALFAASLGWEVSAFDIAQEGKNKAMKLAQERGLKIDYQVGNLSELNYTPAQFDAIALIYAHFPAAIKSQLHKELSNLLKPGGTVIFEAFSKSHLNYIAQNEKVGGPKELDMLFSIEEIQNDFSNYEIIALEEKEIELQEGIYHNGIGSVIRFVGREK